MWCLFILMVTCFFLELHQKLLQLVIKKPRSFVWHLEPTSAHICEEAPSSISIIYCIITITHSNLYFLYILQSLLVCLADMLSLSTKEKLYIRDIHIGYDISLPELSEMTISNSIFNYWKVIQRYLESNPTAKIKIRLK